MVLNSPDKGNVLVMNMHLSLCFFCYMNITSLISCLLTNFTECTEFFKLKGRDSTGFSQPHSDNHTKRKSTMFN